MQVRMGCTAFRMACTQFRMACTQFRIVHPSVTLDCRGDRQDFPYARLIVARNGRDGSRHHRDSPTVLHNSSRERLNVRRASKNRRPTLRNVQRVLQNFPELPRDGRGVLVIRRVGMVVGRHVRNIFSHAQCVVTIVRVERRVYPQDFRS